MWAEDIFPNLAKFKLEQSNSKQVLNGNVSIAVIMAAVAGTISRNNQIKKASKTEKDSKILLYNMRQNFLYYLSTCVLTL